LAGYAREPRAYELMVILLPELADEDLSGAMDRVSRYITDQQGTIKEILTDSPWGRRRLAYTIRFNGQDYRDGYYAIWHFDLVPSNMNDVERELKLDTRVVRYLMVHDDPKWGSPNDGNQPDGATTEEPAATAPAPAAASTEPVVAAPATPEAEANPASSTDEAVTTTDDVVATTDEVVGTAGEPVAIETEPAPAPGSADVAGANGEETVAVVEGTNARVTEPVDETAAVTGGDTTETDEDEAK
jgi:small subunit ribosomal protein S6